MIKERKLLLKLCESNIDKKSVIRNECIEYLILKINI